MKATIAGTIAVVALAITAVSTAGPAAKPQASNIDIVALQKKLNQTNVKLAKLDARVKKLEKTQSTLIDVAVATLAGVACNATLAADAFQATWTVMDQVTQTLQMRTYFGPQTAVNDQKSCSDLRIGRQPATPPSLAAFPKLIDFFYAP
jgi:hypothetical protein